MKSISPRHIKTTAQRAAEVCNQFAELPERLKAEILKIRPRTRLSWIQEGHLGFGIYIKRKGHPVLHLFASVGEFDPDRTLKPLRIKLEIYGADSRGDLFFIKQGSPHDLPHLLEGVLNQRP